MKPAMKIVVLMMSSFLVQLSLAYIPAQVQAFKASISIPGQITDCSSCDFRGTQALAGVDAHGVHMPGVTFQACVVSDANRQDPLMVCVEKQVADLTGINLANADVSKSCFDGAILDNADLTGADFTDGSAIGASLKNAKVTGLISTNATFCNATMPDGRVCSKTLGSWTGQGVTINCNCG